MIEIDRDRMKVGIAGEWVPVTASQYALVEYLMQKPGFVRSRAQIMDAVHGQNIFVDDRTVDTLVRRVRAVFRPFGIDPIETRSGFGYAWRDARDQSAKCSQVR